MRIIGITGTIGAGKGTVVDYLLTKHKYKHYSARLILNEIIEKRGLPPGRDSMRLVANEMREKNGPAAIIIALLEKAVKDNQDSVIESVRTEGEVNSLRKSGQPFVLLAVNADQKLRYDRAIGRGSSTDKISYTKFCEQERVEMTSTDPCKQNLKRCMDLADVTFTNDGSMSDLHSKIGKWLETCNFGK